MGLGNRFAGILLGVAVTLSGQVARSETLADALVHAYENSGLLDQNRALLRAADEDVAQAVSTLMPVISWATTASGTYNGITDVSSWALTAEISAQMTLYDFGASQLAVEAQKETVLGTRDVLRGVEQNVLLGAIRTYLDVRRDAAFVDLRQNNINVLSQEYQAAQDRFNVGEVTKTDVALAEARLAAARSLFAAAEGNLNRSKEAFLASVGRRPGNLESAPAAPLAASESEARAFAARSHPSVSQAQHSVLAAELLVQRGQAAIKPTLTLGGRAGIDGDGNPGASTSLTFGGPIYQGGRLDSQVRQAMASRDAARAGLLVASRTVEQGVGNAYVGLSVARASRLAFEQQIRAAQVAFDGVREEARLGSRTTLDVLNAEQELLDARANFLAAQTDEIYASYAVLASMGLLTTEHLRLPVQRYDPAAYYNLVKDAPTARSAQGAALDRVLQALDK